MSCLVLYTHVLSLQITVTLTDTPAHSHFITSLTQDYATHGSIHLLLCGAKGLRDRKKSYKKKENSLEFDEEDYFDDKIDRKRGREGREGDESVKSESTPSRRRNANDKKRSRRKVGQIMNNIDVERDGDGEVVGEREGKGEVNGNGENSLSVFGRGVGDNSSITLTNTTTNSNTYRSHKKLTNKQPKNDSRVRIRPTSNLNSNLNSGISSSSNSNSKRSPKDTQKSGRKSKIENYPLGPGDDEDDGDGDGDGVKIQRILSISQDDNDDDIR